MRVTEISPPANQHGPISLIQANCGRSCLAAAAKADHDQTITLCSKALEAEPENEQVKQALQTARTAKKSGIEVSSPPPPSGVTQ
jgi:hypothetical protein